MLSHSQARGAFCSSADVTIAYRYWVKHPVLLDSRPADCVTTSASNTGCFAMSAKDGKPCKKCGANEWYKSGECAPCDREKARKWRAANPGKNAEASRKWRAANPEKNAASTRRWSESHREKVYESIRRYRRKNPEATIAIKHRRRTKKTRAGGSYTASEWNALLRHYDNKCLCCGRGDVKLTADHIIPISKGGTSNIDNIQPLCFSCNSSKCDKTIDYRPDAGLGRWIQRKLFG